MKHRSISTDKVHSIQLEKKECSPKHLPREQARQAPEARERQVMMIARGELRFPIGCERSELIRLSQEVIHLRRSQLLAFVANIIAKDILRNAQKDLQF